MVVTTAMVTIMVKRFWLNAPIERPMVATITSVEPRAFMPVPSAKEFPKGQAGKLAADERAAEFSDAGDGDQPERQEQNATGPSGW